MAFTSVGTGIVDSVQGLVTCTWQDQPFTGKVWLGSITVPDAQPNSVLPIQWKAFDGGTFVGSWYANQSSGLMQFSNRPTIEGFGVAAGEVQAFFIGTAFPSNAVPFTAPSPTPAPPSASPFTLANVTATVAEGGRYLLVTDAPVVIGSGLEINLQNNAGGHSLQIIVQWNDGNAGTFTYDIASGYGISGLILPNLGSTVSIQVVPPATGGTTFTTEVITGLPGTFNPPLVQGGVLLNLSQTFANGNNSFLLPPYVGDVWVSAQLVAGVANDLEVQIIPQTYTGTAAGQFDIIGTQKTIPGAALIPPTLVTLPPMINQIQVVNRTGASAGGLILVAPSGVPF